MYMINVSGNYFYEPFLKNKTYILLKLTKPMLSIYIWGLSFF